MLWVFDIDPPLPSMHRVGESVVGWGKCRVGENVGLGKMLGWGKYHSRADGCHMGVWDCTISRPTL